MNIPAPNKKELPSEYAERINQWLSNCKVLRQRKQLGQYMTSRSIAQFMASKCTGRGQTIRILDPGAGSGILSCAVCEKIISNSRQKKRLELTVFEIDEILAKVLEKSLLLLQMYAKQEGCILQFKIKREDFILANKSVLECEQSLFQKKQSLEFDIVISNPPYFKISKSDPRARVAASLVHGQPNIYALFMGVSALLLRRGGKLVFITPRSFASGPYFRKFRESFFQDMQPQAIHVYKSRRKAFKRDGVLQENIILSACKKPDWQVKQKDDLIEISTSDGSGEFKDVSEQRIPISLVLDFQSPNKILRIVGSTRDKSILKTVHSWKGSLTKYGLSVSTGPVVPFRATEFLRHESVNSQKTAPLLWMHNVHPMVISWPKEKNGKSQYILIDHSSQKLLVPNNNYVLIRRFSAKEDKRRLIAAPIESDSIRSRFIGIENHLNYICRPNGTIPAEILWGLASVLNSQIYDEYFRIVNGNTQVSATELRDMPLPPLNEIKAIGRESLKQYCFQERTQGHFLDSITLVYTSKLAKVLAYEKA